MNVVSYATNLCCSEKKDVTNDLKNRLKLAYAKCAFFFGESECFILVRPTVVVIYKC